MRTSVQDTSLEGGRKNNDTDLIEIVLFFLLKWDWALIWQIMGSFALLVLFVSQSTCL